MRATSRRAAISGVLATVVLVGVAAGVALADAPPVATSSGDVTTTTLAAASAEAPTTTAEVTTSTGVPPTTSDPAPAAVATSVDAVTTTAPAELLAEMAQPGAATPTVPGPSPADATAAPTPAPVAIAPTAGGIIPITPMAIIDNDGTYGFTNATTTETTVDQYDEVRLQLDWRVPAGTQAGDTIVQTLPPSLDALSFQSFPVKDSLGRTIATATLGQDADGNPAVVFEFNDLVASATGGAEGTAEFGLKIDRDELVFVDGETTIQVYDVTVTVEDNNVPDAAPTTKNGTWRPNRSTATAQNPDGSLIQTERHLQYAIYFQMDTAADPNDDWTAASFTEPPQNGFRPHCENWDSGANQLNGFKMQRRNADGQFEDYSITDGAMAQLTDVTCNPDGSFSATVTKPASTQDVYFRVYYQADLTVDEFGRPVYMNENDQEVVGFLDTYQNTAFVTVGDETTRVDSNVVGQTAQAQGELLTGPTIDIEKYSADATWEGVVFDADGNPEVDPNTLEPTNQPDEDFDSGPGKELDPLAPQQIRFTITNIGPEPLQHILVGDDTPTGTAITDINCDFSPFNGPGSGMDGGAAVLPPQGFIRCTGMLAPQGPGAVHADTASVTAEGTRTPGTVTDSDDWHAFTPGTPPTTPTTPPTTVPPTTPPTTVPPTTVPPSPGTPDIDIEKYSGTWSGVVFTNGAPTLDANGQPTPQPTNDFDTGALAVPAGQPTTVRFRVTNTGTVALTALVVSDATTAGPAITGVSCTFPDGSVGTTWAGPFAAAASFDCTGTVPALQAGQGHSDTATVAGTYTPPGGGTPTNVTDNDTWGSSATGVLGSSGTRSAPRAATGRRLPTTGGETNAMLALGATIAAAGALILFATRRRDPA